MRKEHRHYGALAASAWTTSAAFLGRIHSRSVVVAGTALALLLFVAAGIDVARSEEAAPDDRDPSAERIDVASPAQVATNADGRAAIATTDTDDDRSADADTAAGDATTPIVTTEAPSDGPDVTSPDATSTTLAATTTAPAPPVSTVASAARTPAAPTTLPSSTTAAPSTTAPPTTTSAPSTTAPPTSTTPPTTTEVTTTTAAPAPTTPPIETPGSLSVTEEPADESSRYFDVHLAQATGAPGTIRFSRDVTVLDASNLSCSSTGCTTIGAAAPDQVWVRVAIRAGRITIQLLDASGEVVGSYRSDGGNGG